MSTITADTTDTQIAVRATSHDVLSYYPNGAPPELCVRLANVCRHYDDLAARGDVVLMRQAMQQARESFDRLTESKAGDIASLLRRMERERDTARQQRLLADIGRRVKPNQAIVERIITMSRAAGEMPDHDGYYDDVIRSAYPDMDAQTAHDISTICTYRMRNPRA